MREVAKPVISPSEPIDEAIARLANYGDALIAQQKRLIDKSLDSSKPADGCKWLSNTSHDKTLRAEKTIHDKIAENPAILIELEAIFGKRKR